MKPFTRRIVLCLVLLLIASWEVTRAGIQYNRGEGGFKLGVDLVGGTILVYEVDTERLKQEMEADKNRKGDLLRLQRMVELADLVSVSTPQLVELIGQRNQGGLVFRQ